MATTAGCTTELENVNLCFCLREGRGVVLCVILNKNLLYVAVLFIPYYPKVLYDSLL